LGETQWAIRAGGELGLVAFLEGNPIRAARLLGRALLSAMANGDIGGQIRFLELIGTGFEEANRHAEALKLFERAIHVGETEKDCGLPFMAYEGESRALAALGKRNDANRVLEDALAKARSQLRLPENGRHRNASRIELATSRNQRLEPKPRETGQKTPAIVLRPTPGCLRKTRHFCTSNPLGFDSGNLTQVHFRAN
jgi:hypothetical protein